MRNYSKVLKIAPAFLLAGTVMLKAQQQDSTKQKEIEQVVLIGYGKQKKTDLTGSIAALGEKDFNRGAITSAEGLLNGRVSGVVVTQSGTPGNDAVIRVRGGSSLLSSNDPLLVVDGLPISGGLSSINPNDIESFSILKDASSTAIYGNRGSNGVILITTKKGTKKNLQVSFNSFVTYNTLAKKVEVYNASEFKNLVTQYASDKVNLLGTANTDWQDLIFKNTLSVDSNLSLMGNLFNKIPSRLSIGQTETPGILLTSDYKRSTASFSLSPSMFDNHLKLNVTGNYTYAFRVNADEGAIGSAISYDPTQSPYDKTTPFAGYREWYRRDGNNYFFRGTSNPLSQLLERRDIGNHQRFYGNINADYKFHFLPDLRLIVNAGLDKQKGDGATVINKFARAGYWNGQAIGNNSDSWYDNLNKNLNTQLNYAKNFGKLSLDVLGGYEYQNFDFQSYGSANRLLYTLDPSNNVPDVNTEAPVNLQAFFGRMNLGWNNNRYILTLNYRRDGSSRFSEDNRWGNFGGAAFAWKMHEDLFADSSVVNELKLRASVGAVGQQDIGGYRTDYFKQYDISNNAYYQFGTGGPNTYYLVARPRGYNQNLTWESSTKYNLGLDFSLFNRRLSGSIDAYVADTKNLLSIVAEGALQNLRILGPRNIGSLQSKGIDLGLNYQMFRQENFTMNVNYNLTYNHLEITDLYTDEIQQGGVGLNGFVQTHKVGLAPFSYWVYQQAYDKTGKPIEGVYVDRNGDGKVDSFDKYNYKKPQADVTMGLMVDGTINKNWDYAMSWRASFGNYVYDLVNSGRAYLSSINNIVDNTLANAPKDFSNTGFAFANRESDYYIKNASFLKLDNVTVGYTLRNNSFIGERTSLRFYGGVQNALIITDYKGMDPEVFNNGIDGTIFPRARMFMFGVNVNF